jgi:hypothetical protein
VYMRFRQSAVSSDVNEFNVEGQSSVHHSSSVRRPARSILAALLLLVGACSAYGADTYDASNKQLTISSVVIGSATYSNMVVRIGAVVSGPTGTSPNGSGDTYNPANAQLTVRTVMLGNATFYNVVATVTGLVTIGSVAGADSYDGTDLTIPNVQVGNTIYTDVVVAVTLGNVVGAAGGMPNAPMDAYNVQSGYLTIPAVQVGSRVYTNVTVSVGIGNVVSVGGHSPVPCSGTGLSTDAYGCWDVNVILDQAGAPVFSQIALAAGLSCPPPGGAFTCLATASGAQYSVMRNGTWSAPADALTAPGSSVGPPSCVSSSFCMEGGITNQGAANVAGAWLVFDGTSWTTIASGVKDTEGPETGIWACGTATFCAAVLTTQLTNVPSDSFQLLTETFSGSWSGYALYPAQFQPGLFNISCVPGGATCIAVGGGGVPDAPAAVRLEGGSVTLLSPPTANDLGAVSCPTSTFCMMIDGAGNFLTYDPAANVWSAPQLVVPAGTTGSGYALTGVSCAAADFCVAIDLMDNLAITYVNGAWGVPDGLDGFPYFVSCPSEQNCYAEVSTDTSLAVETYTRNAN